MISRSIVLILLVFSGTASACPKSLKAYPELCSISDRFLELRESLEREHSVDVDELSEYRALRFIDRGSWERSLSSGNYLAWEIYSPKPSTWMVWEEGAAFLEEELFYKKSLGLEDIKALHKNSITPELMTPWRFIKGGAPGKIRAWFWQLAPGWKFNCGDGITKEQAELIENYDLKSEDGSPLLRYIDRVKSSHRRARGPGGRSVRFKTIEDRKCEASNFYTGHYFHLKSHKVPDELGRWIESFDKAMNGEIDGGNPLQALAKLQRRFVAIHPFGDGNGRVSRFIQDWATHKLELPHLPSGDLQNDILASEKQYIADVEKALKAQMQYLEKCLEEYEGRAVEISLRCRTLYSVSRDDTEEQAEEKETFLREFRN